MWLWLLVHDVDYADDGDIMTMQQPPQQIYCVDQYNTFKSFLFTICTYSFKYYQIWEMHDCHVLPEVRQVQIFKVFLPKTKITCENSI